MTKACSCCLITTGNIMEYTNAWQKNAKSFYLCDDCYMHVNGYSKSDFMEDNCVENKNEKL